MCGAMSSTFGRRFDEAWPKASGELPLLTNFARQMLEQCKLLDKPKPDVDLQKFMEVSEQFPAQFPIDTCRVKSQPEARWPRIQQQIASAYPIIHERTLLLYIDFLEHKRKYGNDKELRVYENMTLVEFVQRLLSQRCVYFAGASDSYKLMNGRTGLGGFEEIGSAAEVAPLLLQDLLSYDEIKLSALLSTSSQTEYINDGSRRNMGRVEADKSLIEQEGVIMGLIGARFDRANMMECQDILITPEQNVEANGYGKDNSNGSFTRSSDYRRIWRNFYEEPKDFRFDEVKKNNKRFVCLDYRQFKLDAVVMKKRFAISFDTLLLESEARALAAGKPAYIHVVGIGLGVWQVSDEQDKIFLEAFEERLRSLAARLTHIGCVHFSWFRLLDWRGLHDGARIGNILVRMSKRNPAEKLAVDMLPVVSWAWDGNSLPGNEFWMGSLSSSSDPAAASSTLITELHNPHINVDYMNSRNLHIASLQHGVLHIAEYARKLLA